MADDLIDYALLKDDLGIATTDVSNDQWLARRCTGVWQRISGYCERTLAVPPAKFVDDWGAIADSQRHLWSTYARPRVTNFLGVFPVVSIDEVQLNGAAFDKSKMIFDAKSGEIISLDGIERDVSHRLLSDRARISYTAGWPTIPQDLYEVLEGVMQVLWAAREAQQTGIGPNIATQINVMDVGSVNLDSANPFRANANKGLGATDPLLGPYTALLDRYIDWRVTIGSVITPTTTTVPV